MNQSFEPIAYMQPMIQQLKSFESSFSGQTADINRALQSIINLGCRTLNMEMGIISQVFGNRYFILNCSAENKFDVEPAQSFSLNDVFCDWVYTNKQMLAMEDTSSSTVAASLAGKLKTGVKAYFGAPIVVNNRVIGTVSFHNTQKRAQPFTLNEGIFIGKMAESLGAIIQRGKLMQEKATATTVNEASTFSKFFNHSSLGMAQVSLQGKWLNINQALCDLLGYSHQELLIKDFQSLTHPDDLNSEQAYVESLMANKAANYEMRKRYIHKSGEVIWAQLSVTLIKDNNGKPQYFVSVVRDITKAVNDEKQLEGSSSELKKLTNKLKLQNIIDPLTKVYNRHFLINTLNNEIKRAARTKLPMAVILLDIDHFKKYNDKHGNGSGDKALTAVANALTMKCRNTDTVAPYGGEEFAVLLPHTKMDSAVSVAEELRKIISKLEIIKGGLTISLGVTCWEPNERDMPSVELLFGEADKALGAAKAKGRNRVEKAALEDAVA